MKYLRKFNEELSPMTYRRAAAKILSKNIKNPALKKRYKSLIDHSDDIRHKMSLVEWKDCIEKFSKYGLINVISECESGTIQENFYFDLCFEKECMVDSYNSEGDEIDFPFFIGLIPPNQDVLDKCLEIFPETDFSNGFFWGFCLSINLKIVGDEYIFNNITLDPYDVGLTGNIYLSNRRGALTIKNALIEAFSKNYPSGYKSHEYTKQVIEETIDELNMSHEAFDVALDGIEKFDGNKLL